jgi:membrane protease YdiL (CAAX protease family)
VSELFSYLKNPGYCPNRRPKPADIFSLLVFYLISTLPLGIIIFIICKVFNITHKELDLASKMNLFIGVIIVPIVEEILFRSLLKFKIINIILFSSTLFTFIATAFYKSGTELAVFPGILLLGFLSLLIIFSRNRIEYFIISRFNYFFYATILLFGLLHATNFTGNPYTILAFSFILGSPQLVLGSILGYIRMNHGLFYSILFHVIVNSTMLLSLFRHH